ncbi:MAG: lytic murein transglycosylase [Candidatus Liptonbacteria bacterium]|nr:lytic murein transglycosylase [Candidatus Liptonbacteria bacterium]
MGKLLKPRVVRDISSKGGDAFTRLPYRLNLSSEKIVRMKLSVALKAVIVAGSFLLFVLGSVTAPTIFLQAAGSSSEEERQALEAKLAELEGQINAYENQVTSYKQQGKTLKGEITTLNGKIAKLNLQIQAITLTLRELNKKIGETQTQIVTTEQGIDSKRATLAGLFKNLYEDERVSLVELFLKNPRLSDFFSDLNNTALVQNNLRLAIEQITDLRNQLKEKQDQFYLAKADAESVRVYQAAQKIEVDSVKAEKNKLLDITKGQESKYQALLKQTKETAAQIRSRIFQLLGGGELSFEEAYKYAKLAGAATGIRPALLLAVLDRESALGQNVGRCNYKTAMSPSSQALFLEITKSLNINPEVVTVSCPNRDGVYGGAMGPAQFIPSTWNLYKKGISSVTKNDPPSPWNNSDAFVATALYLKDAMAGCVSVYSSEASRERCVAAKYYAGGRWRSYLWTYGEAVVNRARSFQSDIDTITG